MPRALDLGLGSKIQAQIMPRMILSTVAWFSYVGNLYNLNQSLGAVAKEFSLGAPKELKLGPDHAQSSRSRLGVDFVDSCMVFMRWKLAEVV